MRNSYGGLSQNNARRVSRPPHKCPSGVAIMANPKQRDPRLPPLPRAYAGHAKREYWHVVTWWRSISNRPLLCYVWINSVLQVCPWQTPRLICHEQYHILFETCCPVKPSLWDADIAIQVVQSSSSAKEFCTRIGLMFTGFCSNYIY